MAVRVLTRKLRIVFAGQVKGEASPYTRYNDCERYARRQVLSPVGGGKDLYGRAPQGLLR